ncbi:ribosomal 5S rRNA E-loop binding protein Ctc/L25/TL5 [Thermocrinis albus DSM 14484]|uniref:Large ribosomal subunit protein bL25 n=1 Tax=Thermocrinis albus (strain DSM 14484 / JCM 11386 / HI 11/12) TaxID=638303 RepID=D3SNW3_THEAH|nr:50S ribosomal protein L25/general stress protein Ctc [Thermocrinis albus]ADC88850.1 ribosomal 5S rRNA E-loop binding protein Ctc/L25/TL5 [Thermocrinis albus DSM 14484]
MKRIEVKLIPRKPGKKSEIKRMRKEGYVPVEIYGKDVENTHAYMKVKDLLSLPHGETFLLVAEIEGEKRVCLLKEVQTGWLGDDPLHVDLYDISHVRELELEVPVEFVGTPAGVGLGGTFEAVLTTLTVKAPIDRIPDKIVVDVSSLGLGDALHVRDIQPPEGCIIMDNPEEVVAVVLEPEVEETTETTETTG